MSSLPIIDSLDFATKQINIYFGLSILITGLIGNIFNIIIFRTRKSFRKTTCAFCLTMASIFNVGQLLSGVFISILAAGFNIDPIGVSYICKIRKIIAQWFGLLSLNSICLATIDRFFLIKYQYSFSLKSVSGFITSACLVWAIHDVFFIFSWEIFHGVCKTTNTNFETYITYIHYPLPTELLPFTIMIIFAFLVLMNLKKNIIRLNCDQELTAMTIIQVIFIVTATVPFIAAYIYSLDRQSTNIEDDARNRLINTIVNYIYYTIYANSFYIYCFASERFRKQFFHLIINVHLKRWQRPTDPLNNNQTLPNTSKQMFRKIRTSNGLSRPYESQPMGCRILAKASERIWKG